MPQMQLPIFPNGVTAITPELAFIRQDGRVVYFNGHMPVFEHPESDIAAFKMITSQFYVNGNVKQSDIVKAFGVTSISVKRAVKLYREAGPRGFFAKRRARTGPRVLTPEVIVQIQTFLADELSVSEISKRLGLKANTIEKAVRAGKITRAGKKKTRRDRV